MKRKILQLNSQTSPTSDWVHIQDRVYDPRGGLMVCLNTCVVPLIVEDTQSNEVRDEM